LLGRDQLVDGELVDLGRRLRLDASRSEPFGDDARTARARAALGGSMPAVRVDQVAGGLGCDSPTLTEPRATESSVRRDVVVEPEGVQRVECAFDRAEAGKALGSVLDLECVAGWLGRIVEVAAADRPGRED
jgi:hypothetical protein